MEKVVAEKAETENPEENKSKKKEKAEKTETENPEENKSEEKEKTEKTEAQIHENSHRQTLNKILADKPLNKADKSYIGRIKELIEKTEN